MPCWVAPSVAAELLKVSVPELMDLVDRGEMEMKEHGGFEFINIGERSEMKCERPSTYTSVTREEQDALMGRDELTETLDIARMRLQSASTRRRRPYCRLSNSERTRGPTSLALHSASITPVAPRGRPSRATARTRCSSGTLRTAVRSRRPR